MPVKKINLNINSISNAITWLIASSIATAFAVLPINAVFINSKYIPFGNDSFYHARRIIDAAFSTRGFYQFDSMINAPEGNWVTWSWGYDYLLAKFLQIIKLFTPVTEPMAILSYVAVAWIWVNMALIIAISNQIGLRPEFRALAALGFALLPSTQILHGIGQIDHHFIELTFILLVTLTTLRWTSQLTNSKQALLCGIYLGVAQAFHHALFILQLPVLITVFALWKHNITFPPIAIKKLTFGLLITTLLIAIPSGPFQDLQFNMATLSWFHPYIALGASIVLTFMTWQRFSFRSLTALAIIGLILAIPAITQIIQGANFLTGSMPILTEIAEVKSPLLTMLTEPRGIATVSKLYSFLILFVPLIIPILTWIAITTKQPLELCYTIFSVFGLSLILFQHRLHYFGAVFMLTSGFWFAQRFVLLRHTDRIHRLVTATIAILIFNWLFRPPLQGGLFSVYYPSGVLHYKLVYPLLLDLQQQCAKDPGIVLAIADLGHFIRYHTDCSVIANNFLFTELHTRKIHEVNTLFTFSPEILAHSPIKYVLFIIGGIHKIRDGKAVFTDNLNDDVKKFNPPLVLNLLANQQQAHVKLIRMVMEQINANTIAPVAGLFKFIP